MGEKIWFSTFFLTKGKGLAHLFGHALRFSFQPRSYSRIIIQLSSQQVAKALGVRSTSDVLKSEIATILIIWDFYWESEQEMTMCCTVLTYCCKVLGT